MFVLGIDGGGTKTKGVIADQFGKIYASETVGGTNHNGVDIHVVERELSSLFTSLKSQNEKAFSMLHTVFAGISGVDRPEAKEVMEKILAKHVPGHVKIIVDNDAVNALYSGTLGVPGIVQIAGTGSITFGINASGERQRAGGWGYLIDDEGSGYDIGRAALNAVFKAYDGRGQKTILTNMLLDHFQVQEPTELIRFIYETGKSRMAIAPLSKYVSAAADKNDEAANQIIQHAGCKLALAIRSLSKRLFKDSAGPIPVVIVGGVFNREDLLMPIMQSKLQELNINVQLIKPEMEPVGGAVIAGFISVHQDLDTSFIENMKKY
ncbi:N-acetylglucosamine kinase [Neobacillus sp. GCM10023253]|uniref:N-acetylglucosamine kinase n=1 Tax=Neobacillus sp. GCM10023253 TaxID=3252644 RepID=UPI00362146E0